MSIIAKKTRESYLDQISGLLIVYMIVYHILQWSDLNNVIHSLWMKPLSFFMFWFFYKSGMFYKKRTSKDILFWGGRKLLVPFLIFSLLGHALLCVQMWNSGICDWKKYLLDPIYSVFLAGSTSGNTPLWFLPTLLAVQFIYNIAGKKISDYSLFVLSLSLAYLLFRYNIHKPLFLGNISLGLAVYTIGYKLRTLQFYKSILWFSILIYVLIFIIQSDSIDFRVNNLKGGIYLLAVSFAICGCVLINNCFKIISKSLGILEYIGRKSMSFYVMHWIIIQAVSMSCNYHGWSLFVTICIASILFLPIADKFICAYHQGWMIGKKTT